MGRRPCASRTWICCLSWSDESSEVVMTAAACSARTPKRRNTGCARDTCRGRGCRRFGRTEPRAPAGPWPRASRTPSKGHRRLALPRCDQGHGRGACRSRSRCGLVLVGGLHPAWWLSASGLRKRITPDARGRDAEPRQPEIPVEGEISLASTDSGTYWTLVLLGCCRPKLRAPRSGTPLARFDPQPRSGNRSVSIWTD